jgi:crotonobetainyl-CoA:carnitine CoA-transferase CaiB-like acyl-CoA transferase
MSGVISARALDMIDGLGAYGPKLFAGLGAEVIRVEPPGGSLRRRLAPFADGSDISLEALHYDAGKKSITLDIRQPRGRELLSGLLDKVDVVFDNGDLLAAGFDLDALAAKGPPLVVVSVTPFGLDSARSSWLGDDLVCQAMSGMISYFGYRGERPAHFGPHQASEMSGLAACLGALIALFGARRTGRGDVIDIAAERVGALVTNQMSNASLYHQFGFIRKRHERGNADLTLYEARDGYVQMGAFRDLSPLARVLEKVGDSPLPPDFTSSIAAGEFARHPKVREAIQAFVGARTKWQVAEAVQAEGVMCVPVTDAADIVHDPFLEQRGFFAEVSFEEAAGRAFRDIGVPMRFSDGAFATGGELAAPGADNAEVYGALGLSSSDLGVLRAEGVI